MSQKASAAREEAEKEAEKAQTSSQRAKKA